MGLEEDLFEALRHVSMGTGRTFAFDQMIRTLMNSVEVSSLRQVQGQLAQLQEQLNMKIAQLSRATPGVQSTGLDPFTILGVDQNASKEEVDTAFRKKAKENHPDRGGNNREFIVIQAAKEAIYRFRGWS